MEREIIIQVKQLSKKRSLLEKNSLNIELPNFEHLKLRNLITAVVTKQVKEFNEQNDNGSILKYLKPTEIEDSAQVGKVGFNHKYNNKTANLEDSIKVAIQGFMDGVYFVFINEKKIESIDQEITLEQGDQITFLRLTFLSGGIF